MALHLLSLPWTETTKEWESEAFTARTRVMASAIARYGPVILYGGEANESKVTEHVTIHDRAWQKRHWPDVGFDTVFADYDPNRRPWVEWAVHAADAVRKRAHPGDTLGLTMGTSQFNAAELLADLGLRVVELGIGYRGVWAPFRVFESWAWRMYHAGFASPEADTNGDVRNYDDVIPRPYDAEDFPRGDGGGGYLAYMGRIVSRKGPHIAAEIARRSGMKLKVAGPGVASTEPGKIVSEDGTVLWGDVEYVGMLKSDERAKFLGEATATLMTTTYFEPFGGVHAESMLCGTPVVGTDWAVMHENIVPGVNGYIARAMGEFLEGVRQAPTLDRTRIRDMAIAKFGADTVGRQYNDYLTRLASLRRLGYYEIAPRKWGR